MKVKLIAIFLVFIFFSACKEKKTNTDKIPCEVTYECFRGFGPRGHHMLTINSERWHYPQTFNPNNGPYTEDQMIEKVTEAHCRDNDLRLLGFVEGWIHECD